MNKFLLTLVMLANLAYAETPKTIQDLKNTSVRILNLDRNSGGTGSIFRSYSTGSHILTNKHVCRLIEPGGYVDHNGNVMKITHYKKFDQHDLCLVRVATDLKINLEISETLVQPSSTTIVSGHPSLLPHIATTGHMSERQDINLVVGLRECTKEDVEKDPLTCAFFGGYPVVKTFDSQLVSNLIKPGNSGSAVFNNEGQVVGVVFAGAGRDFSFGYIVPQIYLLFFIQNAHRFPWVEVGTPVEDGGIRGRVFSYERCHQAMSKGTKFLKIQKLCKGVTDSFIWRK